MTTTLTGFFNVFGSHPLPMLLVHQNTLQIQASNAAAQALYQSAEGELVQQKFFDFFSHTPPASEAERWSGLKAGQSISGFFEHRLKNGNHIFVEVFASVFPAPEPLLQVSVVNVTGCNTRQRQETEKVQMLANLVDQTSELLITADLECKPLTWNKAAETITGLKPADALGKKVSVLLGLQYANTNYEELLNAIRKNGFWRGEASFLRPTDGLKITVLINFKLLRNNENIPVGVLIDASDITDRKDAEIKLLESDNRFRELADAAPVMVWMCNENNKLIYLNRQWLQFTGSRIASKRSRTWTAHIFEEDLAEAKKLYDAAFAQRQKIALSYRLRYLDGSYKWVYDVSVPRFLVDGTFVGYIGTITEIEDQKKTEEQLRYQANILENVSEIVVTTDLDFTITTWNKAARQYYNISEADAVGKRIRDLVQFQFFETNLNEVRAQLLETGTWSGEVAIQNGEELLYFFQTVKHIYNSQNQCIGFLAVGRNITERKKIEQRLEQSERFYRTLISNSLDGLILMNGDGQITFCSPSVEHVLGFTVNEIEGKNGFDFVHHEDLAWAFDSFQQELAEVPENKSITIRLRHKTDEWAWCMVRGNNLLSHPNIKSIVVHFHDDRLRKNAADALKQSEKKFRTLVKDLQIGVLLHDAEGKLLMANNAALKMFDVKEEDYEGKQVWKLFSNAITESGQKLKAEDRPICRVIQEKKLIKDFVMGVWLPNKKEHVWLLVSADPLLDEHNNLRQIVCSFSNITERKQLEQRLLTDQINHQKLLTQASIDGQEKERMEIGKELHDNFGQQLTTIKLFLDLAKTTADENTAEMVSMALKGVSDVINEIRSMSRSLVPYTLKDLGLVESVSELVTNVSRSQLLPIEFDCSDFNEDILADNQKLTLYRIVQEQLNNISKHASASQVFILLQNSIQGVTLQITDDGKGFDEKQVTKGLGFANIKNRIELFGGRSQIIAAPGAGCTLKVFMPAKITFPANQLN